MKYRRIGDYDLFVSTSEKTVRFYCMDYHFDGGIETSLIIHKMGTEKYLFIYDRKSYSNEFIVEKSEHHKYYGVPDDFLINYLLKLAKRCVEDF